MILTCVENLETQNFKLYGNLASIVACVSFKDKKVDMNLLCASWKYLKLYHDELHFFVKGQHYPLLPNKNIPA